MTASTSRETPSRRPPSQERTERDPLLPQPGSGDAHPRINPLPKGQLAAIYTIKLLVPVAGTQFLPYLNVMMERLLEQNGIGKDKVGYYTGLASSVQHISQLISIYYWGRISDRIGRIPVILIGTTGLAVITTLFGLSQTVTSLLVTRFLGGFFTGIIGALHSVVGELSDETNQSTAFPLYDIISALGFVIGPFIGGYFADPTVEHPSWPWHANPIFSRLHRLLEVYPYLLPCLITSVFAVVTTLLGVFVLEETLPSKRSLPKAVDDAPGRDGNSEEEDIPSAPPSLLTLLRIPVIRDISLSSFSLGFLAAAFNVVFVLMAYTDVSSGGLGFDPSKIGTALSLMGLISIPLKLSMSFILRPDKPHILTSLFNFAMRSWVVTFIAFPVLSLVLRAFGGDESTSGNGGASGGIVWTAVGGVLFLSRIGCMAFTMVMILVRENAPSSNSLGTINGLTELAQVLAISISPITISSLFAFSITHHVLGGYLWVLVYVLFSFVGAFIAGQVGKHRVHGTARPRNLGD